MIWIHHEATKSTKINRRCVTSTGSSARGRAAPKAHHTQVAFNIQNSAFNIRHLLRLRGGKWLASRLIKNVLREERDAIALLH
jgi:hypothetical protein